MTQFPGAWSDIVYSPTYGFVVVVGAGNGVTAYRVDNGAVIWTTSGTWTLYLRACVYSTGEVMAIVQDGATGQATLYSAAGAQPLGWPALGSFGVLLTLEAGELIAYVVQSGTTYVRQVVGGPRATPQAMPIQTSQGWVDFDPSRGGLLLKDLNATVTVNNFTMLFPTERGGCWAGQPTDKRSAVVGTYQASAFQTVPGAVGGSLPHIATDGNGNFACTAPLNGGVVGVSLLPPFPAWAPLPPVPPDPPVPPIPPDPPIPPVPPDPPVPPIPPTPPAGGPMQSDLVITPLVDLTHLAEVPHPAGQGLFGLKTDAGKFKSWHDGVWQADKDGMGPWEAFLPYGGVYLARRNDGSDPRQAIVGSRLPDVIPAP